MRAGARPSCRPRRVHRIDLIPQPGRGGLSLARHGIEAKSRLAFGVVERAADRAHRDLGPAEFVSLRGRAPGKHAHAKPDCRRGGERKKVPVFHRCLQPIATPDTRGPRESDTAVAQNGKTIVGRAGSPGNSRSPQT